MDRNNKIYSSEKVVRYYNKEESLQKSEHAILELLKDRMDSMKMLDIGVGTGRTTLHFAPLVKEYIGIDYSEKMIEACKNKFADIKFFTMDARDLSLFSENEFDFILFSFNGIDYISFQDRIKALQEIKRILKPNGYFVFSTHNIQALKKWNYMRFTLNPFAFIENLKTHYKRKSINNLNIKEVQHLDYVIINDGAHDWQLETCYIMPSCQIKLLKDIGFKSIRVFNLAKGKEIKYEMIKFCKDNWLYYLCN